MAVGGALFSGGRGQGAAGGSGSRALVEFKAGKMNFNSASKMVTPDKRKGLVCIEQGEEDHLMHFRWKDRGTGKVEDDLIIFPDDIEFKRVTQCTTGRVYVLKFTITSRKMFFWMQEPKTDKDEEHCKKVNDLLNNPPAPGSAAARGGGGSGGGLGGLVGSGGGLDLSNLGDTELQSLLSGMNQQQLMQLFGGSLAGSGLPGLLGQSGGGGGGRERRSRTAAGGSGSSSSATPAAATTTSSTGSTTSAASTASAAGASAGGSAATASSSSTPAAKPIQLSDLQGILSGINPEGGAAGGGSATNVDLASGLNAEAMQPLLTNPDFVKKMKDLLPAEHQGAENLADEVKGTVKSPQFQQALSLFSSAFQSGQLAPLIREFDLGDEAVAAATAGNLEAFSKAMEDKAKKAPKKDEPEDMALD